MTPEQKSADVWREELIAALSIAIAEWLDHPDLRPDLAQQVARSAVAAVLPLIEEHERAGEKPSMARWFR